MILAIDLKLEKFGIDCKNRERARPSRLFVPPANCLSGRIVVSVVPRGSLDVALLRVESF